MSISLVAKKDSSRLLIDSLKPELISSSQSINHHHHRFSFHLISHLIRSKLILSLSDSLKLELISSEIFSSSPTCHHNYHHPIDYYQTFIRNSVILILTFITTSSSTNTIILNFLFIIKTHLIIVMIKFVTTITTIVIALKSTPSWPSTSSLH